MWPINAHDLNNHSQSQLNIAANLVQLYNFVHTSLSLVIKDDLARRGFSSLEIWANVRLGLMWNPATESWDYVVRTIEGLGHGCLWTPKAGGDEVSRAGFISCHLEVYMHHLDTLDILRPSVARAWWSLGHKIM